MTAAQKPPEGDQKPDPLDELLGIIDEGEDRAQLKKKVDGAWGWVAEIDISAGVMTAGDLMRMVRGKWGPGTYKLEVRDAKTQYKGQRVFRVLTKHGAPEDDDDDDAPAPSRDGDRLARLERMVERLAMGGGERGPGIDGNAIAQIMSASLQASTSMMAPLLEGLSKSKGPSTAELLELVKTGMELKSEASAPSDPYGPVFANLLAGFQGAGATPAAPNPSPAPATPPAMPPAHPEHVRQLAAHLPSLELAAAGGVPPAKVAELVANGTPDALMDALEANADELPDQLAAAYPRLEAHKAYVAAVVDVLFPPEPQPGPGDQEQPEDAPEPAAANAGGSDVRDS